MTDVRWIKEETGSPVTQVAPSALVRVQADGAVPLGGLIRVFAEPEGVVRRALRSAGVWSRSTITTLRWDATASPAPHAAAHSQPWYAAQVGPPESFTRVV